MVNQDEYITNYFSKKRGKLRKFIRMIAISYYCTSRSGVSKWCRVWWVDTAKGKDGDQRSL